MPKPLSHLGDIESYGFRPGAIVNERPELALKMMGVLTHWPFVESEVANLLLRILGPDSKPAVEAYVTEPDTEAERRIVGIYGEQARSTQYYTFFRTLLRMFAEDYRDRARLAHWFSGATPDHPDIILLVNPTEYRRRQVDAEEDTEARELALQHEDLAAILSLNVRQREKILEHEHIYFYTAESFQRLEKRLTDLVWAFSHFQSLADAGDDALRARRLQRLLDQPRFAAAMKALG